LQILIIKRLHIAKSLLQVELISMAVGESVSKLLTKPVYISFTRDTSLSLLFILASNHQIFLSADWFLC